MKTFKILALGPSGSGKTVFLASIFKALGIQGEQGFYLHVDDPYQRKMLNAIYTEILIGELWPRGTRYSEISEWQFVCRVKNPDLDSFNACTFVYYDYAGGRLTDQELQDDEELQHQWAAAQQTVIAMATKAYDWAINHNIAKEQARVVLPEGLTVSRMYMTGSVRSWIHYCQLRMASGTQKEHREVAIECWNNLILEFPSLKELNLTEK